MINLMSLYTAHVLGEWRDRKYQIPRHTFELDNLLYIHLISVLVCTRGT